MRRIFDTVEPVWKEPNANDTRTGHRDVYGHKVRELLILACMENECSWKGILRANGSTGRRTTEDYVKLKEPLGLGRFEVSLTRFPNWPAFKPFETWLDEVDQYSQSLPWYAAYNKTKHDAEENFDKATLEHAVSAVGAALVMHFVQFGRSIVQEMGSFQLTDPTPRYYVPRVRVEDEHGNLTHAGFHNLEERNLGL